MIPVTGWGNLQVMVSFVIHLGLFVYAVRKLREKHILSFAILYYFIAIAAYSNVVTPVAGIVGERFLFNASLGFVIASVYLIFRIFRTEPRSLTIEFNERAKIVVIFFLLLIPLTVMTIQRNSEWHSLGELYESDIKYLEKSVRANVQYAEFRMGEIYRDPEYRLNGTVYEPVQQVIISHFLTALKLYPDDYTTLNDLGEAYTNLSSKVDSGIVFLKKATALRPELQPAWMNMAMAYHKQNKLDSAISCYERVLKINPGALTAVLKMADLYNEKGEFGRAVKMNEAVMKSYPNLDIPYFNIGYYFILLGDTATGIRYWEQAAQRNASYEVCINLGMIYRAAGDRVKARYFFRLAEEARQRGNTENNP
jgi:Tfp pilus assembly protein PilF